MSKKDTDQCLSLLALKPENKVWKKKKKIFIKFLRQVVNLHYMLSKAQIKSRPNILWCYKKELGFTTDDRSRFKQLKKKTKQKLKQNPDATEKTEEILNDPFHLFLSATDVRFCYFKETQQILGQTYGMLVLQVRIFFFC